MKKILFIMILTLITTFTIEASEPNFIIKNTENQLIHIKDLKQGLLFEEYKGKAIFLIMFGHNCPPCREEMPELIKLSKEYKDKLAIVAIEVQGYNTSQLAEFKKNEGINYNLVSGDDNSKFVQHIFQRAKWRGEIPFLIAIDKYGEVKDIKVGMVPKNILEGLIETLTK